MTRIGRPAALFFLGIILLFELRSFRPREFAERLRVFPAMARMPCEEAILHGTVFGFDRRYGHFLDGLRWTIPPDATVAVGGLGASSDYLYTAAYILAPRPVVTSGSPTRTDYVVVFGGGQALGRLP